MGNASPTHGARNGFDSSQYGRHQLCQIARSLRMFLLFGQQPPCQRQAVRIEMAAPPCHLDFNVHRHEKRGFRQEMAIPFGLRGFVEINTFMLLTFS